jgi:hypothetical protein
MVTSRGDDRMGQAPAGKPEARGDVLEFKVREFVHDLCSAQASRSQGEDIGDADERRLFVKAFALGRQQIKKLTLA